MGDGMLSLAWNNHSSTFCHMLSTLRGLERYTDVTVACEGKFYGVHKLVLASCSDYFLKMFEKTPCKHPVVVLKDIQGKDIEALLSYMYDGVVSVAQSDLARLINAAEVLQIKGLAVPDEPPVASKKAAHTRCSSDDRSSPQQKRARREDPSSNRHKSRDSSPQSSSFHSDSEPGIPRQNASDNHSANRSSNQRDTDVAEQSDSRKKGQNEGERNSVAHQIKATVEVSVIKEEVETQDDDDIQEAEFDFDPLGQDMEMDNTSGLKGLANLELPVGFNSPTEQSFDSQAGPSGLQTWSNVHEGDVSNQGYPGDMSLDASSVAGQSGSHPQQPHHMITGNRDYRVGSNVIPYQMPFESPQSADASTRSPSCQQENINLAIPTFHHCLSCSFSTPNEADLFSHTCTNEARKQYSCPYCPYSTRFQANLTVHKRSHTGEKPYACPYCSYRSALASNLKIHVRSHTGERPYKCPQCPASFLHSSHRKKHLKVHQTQQNVHSFNV